MIKHQIRKRRGTKTFHKCLFVLVSISIFIFLPQALTGQTNTVSETPVEVTFTSPGTGTWTVPSGVRSITVEVWGAGGSGGTGREAGGGGGGGYARSTLLVTPGNVINYEVGGGGGPETDGGNTTFNTTLTGGGGDSGSGSSGGTGGAGSGGNVANFNGGNGGDGGVSGGRGGGGGGGSATSSANGGDGQNNSGNTGGSGGSGEGDGGDGADGNNNNGNNGLNPGGGGGGESGPGNGGTSGTGGDGQIIITYTTYEVDLTGGPCWRSLSSPVQGATYADILSGLWTQGVPGSDSPTFGDANVLLWPDVTGVSDASWAVPADLDNVVPEGTGFLVSVFADDDFDGSADPFPKTISVSGAPYEADVSPAMNSSSDGWTFVGNPFGSSIDFDNVTKTDLTNTAYVYDRNTGGPTNGNNGSWISTDGTVGDLANGEIAPFQGFFVQNDGSSPAPEITFTESSKITSDAEFYGKMQEVYAVRLQLQGQGVSNSAWLRFSEHGSKELVKGDALQLYPFGGEFAILSSRKEDQLLDIGQYSNQTSQRIEIPVYVETTKNGEYQITATDLTLPPGLNLELYDLEADQTIPLVPDFSYSFEINQVSKSRPDLDVSCGMNQEQVAKRFSPQTAKAIASDRFILRASTQQKESTELPVKIALNQNYPNPFNPHTQITYQLPQQSDVRLEVFDMAGRQVATLVSQSVSAGSHTVNFDASDLSSGVYLYKLQAGSTVLTKKLTLIK